MPSAPLPDPILDIIRRSLAEDIGDGDITAAGTIPAGASLSGRFLAKADGIVAGLEVARMVFHELDPALEFNALVQDGARVGKGEILATVRGNGRAILSAERVALNLLQRMSGIATATRRYVEAVAGTKAIILDTRKTAPGLRLLDKWAVRLGGGQNHRAGLYDMALIKDNHIAAVGGISEAVRRVRAADERRRPIEVEVQNLDQLREALELGIDRIMLDNMSIDAMREAVHIASGRTPLEASGNVNLNTVAAVAAAGVDFISVGALTHSVIALDISLDLDPISLEKP